MKKMFALCVILMMSALQLPAEGMRILLLDCKNETGLATGGAGAGISADAIAKKGSYAVGKQLVNSAGYVLIDRRDLTSQTEKAAGEVAKAGGKLQPSFLHTAQMLNADLVLRTTLASLSSGKEMINQGGYKAETEKYSLRVMIEALDPVDGTVVAMADAASTGSFRQTDNVQTTMGEDDVLVLLDKAAAAAVVDLKKTLDAWVSKNKDSGSVKLNISTSDDPALVEIDGMLIGSTPLKDHTLKAGDHVITIGRPGYLDISKKVLLEKDTEIKVPMLRKDLSADELKEILKNLRIGILSGIEPAFDIGTLERVQ